MGLAWISSYISDYKESILKTLYLIRKSYPSGQYFGPILYCWYTNHVSGMIRRFGWLHHSYTDDTNLHCNKEARCFVDKLSYVRNQIMDQHVEVEWWYDWINLVASSRMFQSQRGNVCWREHTGWLYYTAIELVQKLKNLRVIFDQLLSMQSHVNTVASRAPIRGGGYIPPTFEGDNISIVPP